MCPCKCNSVVLIFSPSGELRYEADDKNASIFCYLLPVAFPSCLHGLGLSSQRLGVSVGISKISNVQSFESVKVVNPIDSAGLSQPPHVPSSSLAATPK